MAEQVENTMQNQPSDFVGHGIPFPKSIAPGALGRDHDVTEKSRKLVRPVTVPEVGFFPGKGKHIRRPILASIGRVHAPDRPIANETNIEVFPTKV